mgnify:CR=1 FL=1
MSAYETDLDKNPANYQPLTPLTFLARSAAVYPEQPAIIHGNQRTTYAQFYARCRQLASSLAKAGIRKGETVSVLLANTPAMLECHYGVPMTGGVLNTLNTRLDAPTIAFSLAHAEARILIVDKEFSKLAREALAEALSDFDGAIVLVSHDRHLIGLVSETFWRVADGRVDPFNGDLDEYAVWLKARGNKADQSASKARSEAKAEAAKPPAAPKCTADLVKLHKQVEKLESRMVELDSQLAHIQEEMARPELYQSDGGAVLLQLGQQQQKLESERAEAEARWLEAYGALENG